MIAFAPHGEYRLDVDDRIVRTVSADAMNDEAIAQFGRDMAAVFEGFAGRPFGYYCVYGPGVLLTPDAIEQARPNILNRHAKGGVATAVNFSQSDHPTIIRAQIAEIYREMDVVWREFETYDEAKAWLLEKIAEADRASGPNAK